VATGGVALAAGLAALLTVLGCYAFNRVVLGDGLGLALPALLVRIGSAVLGTAAAGLVTVLGFRLVDGPLPRTQEKTSLSPPANKTLPRGPEPGAARANGDLNLWAAGKENLRWT
jgi:hypothetical protein